MSLTTLSAPHDTDAILAALDADGAVILEGVINDAARGVLVDDLMRWIKPTPRGRDDFTGRDTQRTGALVARVPATRPLVMHATILDAAHRYLEPWTERILLHLTQTIYIHPGQGAQTLHRDRLAWGTHMPASIEPQFNTMWALTDFTADNGATRVVPGSHKWDWEHRAEREQIVQAEMAAGSVLLYTGSVLHSGGENHSDAARLGLNITYCLGWLRQEENQYLSCPPHIAQTLEPGLQELLGYTQGNYALGYFSDPESQADVSDILPPEMVLGRMPREGRGFSATSATEDGASADFVREITRQDL